MVSYMFYMYILHFEAGTLYIIKDPYTPTCPVA